MKLQLQYPLEKATIFQKFGENQLALYKDLLKINGHNGLDFIAPDSTPVYATHDGEVTFAGDAGSGGGLGVVIRTSEKFDYKGEDVYFKSIYWHLKTGGIIVKVGQMVKAGEKIALSNNTGISTGPHLHFGLKPVKEGENSWTWMNVDQDNGYNGAIDPVPYFNGKSPKSSQTTQPEPVLALPEAFLNMQRAILAFQLSEGVTVFRDKPLETVKYGPTTLLKAKKYLK